MYPLTAKWTILPGNEEKAVAALKQLALDVQKNEPNTLLYMVHLPDFNQKMLPTPPAGEVVFWEIYKDQQAFFDHIGGPVFTDFVKNYGDLFLSDFNQPPQVFMLTEVFNTIGGFSRQEL